jgi:beta-phosphoglucomutase
LKLRKKTKINGYLKNEEYLSYLVDMDQSEILPGVIPMLKYLKRKTKQLLWARQVKLQDHLGETGIIHYFDVIVDGNDVSNAKPDPEVFLIAAKLRCRTRRRHCFEDSVAGVQAANIGKMMSIGIGKKNTI